MYSVLTELSSDSFFYGGDYRVGTDVKNASSGSNAIAIDAHLDDVFFDIRFASIVGIVVIKCLVCAFAVMTFVSLLAVIGAVFGNLFG